MAVRLASDEYKRLRSEVAKMANTANKRLNRLESNNLQMLPAYTSWQENGAIKFSVKGKSYNQLQTEYWRLKNFLDNRTSTVREANRFLREMAVNTGIKYHGLKDLKAKSANFFRLAEKIKEYNSKINQSAQAINYQRIWQQINTYIKSTNTDLANAISSDEQLDKFLKFMAQVEQVEYKKEGYQTKSKKWDFTEI